MGPKRANWKGAWSNRSSTDPTLLLTYQNEKEINPSSNVAVSSPLL